MHFSYRVAWSDEDGEFVATVEQFRLVSWLAPTPGEAFAGLLALLEEMGGEERLLAGLRTASEA